MSTYDPPPARCPCCGSAVTVHGDGETHWYQPEAAPDLLAACRAALEALELGAWHCEEDCAVEGRSDCEVCAGMRALRAALRKATGETP